MEQIRVLVVDESPGLTQGLLLALPRRGPIVVLGPVLDAPEAIDVLKQSLADLAVVDVDRADGRGLEVLTAIRDGSSRRVLASTESGNLEVAAQSLAAGACGVLPVERTASILIDSFKRVMAGELVLPAADLPVLLDRILDAHEPAPLLGALASLTGRENEILCLLAEGVSTIGIASELSISPMTVQSHVKNILSKLGVHSKVDAVRLAWRHGLAPTTRTA
jgi:DNA-binding NarL/FixJ family response regulator